MMARPKSHGWPVSVESNAVWCQLSARTLQRVPRPEILYTNRLGSCHITSCRWKIEQIPPLLLYLPSDHLVFTRCCSCTVWCQQLLSLFSERKDGVFWITETLSQQLIQVWAQSISFSLICDDCRAETISRSMCQFMAENYMKKLIVFLFLLVIFQPKMLNRCISNGISQDFGLLFRQNL